MTRSHYIPQFILRHFCVDNSITYCDLVNQNVESRNTKSVFSEKGYYPNDLEKALCERIEAQFANILNNKILSNRYKVILNADELMLLKKYLLISVFRFKYEDPLEKEVFANCSKEEVEEYKGNFYENINKILNCQTKEEMFDYTNFEDQRTNPTLTAYVRDILFSYLVFVTSATEEEEFLISDRGYASYEGPGKYEKLFTIIDLIKESGDPQLIQISSMMTPHDFSVFPLSKTMSVITMSPFYKILYVNEGQEKKRIEKSGVIQNYLGFENSRIINPPKLSTNNDKVLQYHYLTSILKTEDMVFLNTLMMINAKQYVACSDLNHIQETVKDLNADNDLSYMLVE